MLLLLAAALAPALAAVAWRGSFTTLAATPLRAGGVGLAGLAVQIPPLYLFDASHQQAVLPRLLWLTGFLLAATYLALYRRS